MTHSTEYVGSFIGGAPTAAAPIEASSARNAPRYETAAAWMQSARSWEAGDTNRLNKAHWANARDVDINSWLREQLSTLRARATHEVRNNGILAGVSKSLEDDIVGPDGPMLEVQSSDPEYNKAAEANWRQWFKAPTFRPNVSGASWLKLCVRNLPKCGEFVTLLKSDPNAAGPVQLRLHPIHPRRLASPVSDGGRNILGIEFDQYERPARYWIAETNGYSTTYVPYSPDDVIHEFCLDEEGQVRGYPWITPSLPAIAELRDFDDQIQDAARQMADQCSMLYTDHPDAPFYAMPESTEMERRTAKMCPPGWKPSTYQATAPPVQYPDFRAEKHRDMGRPFNMPLMMVRLDASKHNYSSARIDTQSYNRMIEGVQCWLSGTPESVGMLNRLVDLVNGEARFSVPALRRRPDDVEYIWTWPQRPHVDPTKEADAEGMSLETGTLDMISALAARGTTIERLLRAQQRAIAAYEEAGLVPPAWMQGSLNKTTPEARTARKTAGAIEEATTANAK